MAYPGKMYKLKIENKYEMQALAKKIASLSKIGDIIGLKGSLGVGKSFFARHFINFLSKEQKNVPSPTFNLVYSYPTEVAEIYHFDLYRLKSSQELENIGFFEAIREGICIIEWPQIASAYLKSKYLEIEIKNFGFDSEIREVTINADIKWQERIKELL